MAKKQATTSFKEIPVIGALPDRKIAAKLRDMGDKTTAEAFMMKAAERGKKAKLFGWGGPLPAWKHTNHQIGYIPLLDPGTEAPQPIRFGGTVVADPNLKDKPINIHLDKLRVYQYPGGGKGKNTEHKILFTFKAQNQLPKSSAAEQVTFSQSYKAIEGENVATFGQPIFIGLNVGPLGVGFEVSTVNVRNASDQTIMDVLESGPFKSGLSLLETAQPVLKPFSDITLGIAKMFAMRNDNVKVQEVWLGLDLTPAALGVRLAQGNYIIIQVPKENEINWNEWEFSPPTGTILRKTDKTATLAYNYVIFRVSLST